MIEDQVRWNFKEGVFGFQEKGEGHLMRRFLPILVLVLMAPTVAELLWGTTPLSEAPRLLVLIPVYGAGTLLIRDLVRYRRRGWISILLLGAAYALAEEGLALQFLFHPTLLGISGWGARVLGINGVYTEWAIGYHAIWSVALPILLVDILFPNIRNKPYLRIRYLFVCGAVYLLGVAILAFFARRIPPIYSTPPMLLALTVLVVLLLAFVALVVLPPVSPRQERESLAPSPWTVLSVGLGAGFFWQAILILTRVFFPAFVQGVLVLIPMLGAVALAILVFWLVSSWIKLRSWNDLQWLSLASGALIAHTIFGILFLTVTPLDKLSLAVLGAGMVLLLILFAIRLRGRPQADIDVGGATS
jgi:hypothetical protein